VTTLVQVAAIARDLILIGLGIYATVILKKRLELKESEIESMKATVEHFKAMQAPSLAKDLKELSALADQLSASNRNLQARIEKERDRNAASEIEKARISGMAAGIIEGVGAVFEISRTFNIQQSGREPQIHFVVRPLGVVIAEKRHQLQASLGQAVKGQLPDFPNTKTLRALFEAVEAGKNE
jgi:hypothetical protein